MERRSGGDAEVRRQMLEGLAVIRDKVLDRAWLEPGATVLDAGCGDGLIGFGALERGAGHVVFSDISQDVLDLCSEAATGLGISERCSFVRAPVEALVGVADAAVDVACTRSVLIYVKDKKRAFAELFRVLRPGGRISLFEPINRFGIAERAKGFCGYPSDGVADLAARVEAVYAAIQPPDDPMLDFDERDLLALAETAGFFPRELELTAEISPKYPLPWAQFANSSGNPRIPTISEAMEQALTPEERDRFTEHLRPLVEEGKGVQRMATVFLTGVRP
jgi:ubiquinone/menaquinone biosynthesis C-methylase UbiE